MRNMLLLTALLLLPIDATDLPGPPWTPGPAAPWWRNDSANIAVTVAFNEYLSQVPFTSIHDGSVTDSQPVHLDWSVIGDMPRALKDGVSCWMGPSEAFPEGEVLLAGGLWPVGVAHEPSGHSYLNYSFAYDVARRLWKPLPLPPFEPGRTQGACLTSSLIIISGGDGGNIGSKVMRLSKSSPAAQWTWDASLPALPPSASRITGAAHAINDRWLLIGLGNANGKDATKAGAMVSYRLDLHGAKQWEPIPPYPLSVSTGEQISVPISAVVNGKWLVFGGGYSLDKDSAASKAWAKLPFDIADLAVFGPRPSGATVDLRGVFEYDPVKNEWAALPKLPSNFVQGPKHAPVVGNGRYILLLGMQRRLTGRRGTEPPGYMAAVGRPPIENVINYYGDDAIYYDTVNRAYGSLGKIPYGMCTVSWVCNGTHVIGFGGEPGHGWNGNTESVIQMAAITLTDHERNSLV